MTRLLEQFYKTPKDAKACMTVEEYNLLMKETKGIVLSCGQSWDIIRYDVGCGIVRVTLGLTKGQEEINHG